ncbi:hypothetical protein ACIP8U_25930 [Streptomyces pseudovenezuelae]|uniref:hypothetical protein n=1 Tax=Streptomyces pseudovenezuelae TaxID=67350 RepID=UPI0036F0A219
MSEEQRKGEVAADAAQPVKASQDEATSESRDLVTKGCLAAVGGTFSGLSRAIFSWVIDTWLDGGGTDGNA